MKKKFRFLILGVIVFVISCVTVNIYFPAAEVQKAADVIVEDVRQIEKKQEQKPQEQQKLNQYYQRLKKLSWGTAAGICPNRYRGNYSCYTGTEGFHKSKVSPVKAFL